MMSIKELRQMTHMSQSKFAEKYKINKSTLQKWEGGFAKTPPHYLYAMNELLKYEGYFYDSVNSK